MYDTKLGFLYLPLRSWIFYDEDKDAYIAECPELEIREEASTLEAAQLKMEKEAQLISGEIKEGYKTVTIDIAIGLN